MQSLFLFSVSQVILEKQIFGRVISTVIWLIVGIGDPAYFYIEAAFLLNGILLGVLFVFGIYLR